MAPIFRWFAPIRRISPRQPSRARKIGTEKSDVSGISLSRAVRTIAYALARASPPVRDGGLIQTAANNKITGEASLRIKLARGLVSDGGVQSKGDLFKQILMDRGATPLRHSERRLTP